MLKHKCVSRLFLFISVITTLWLMGCTQVDGDGTVAASGSPAAATLAPVETATATSTVTLTPSPPPTRTPTPTPILSSCGEGGTILFKSEGSSPNYYKICPDGTALMGIEEADMRQAYQNPIITAEDGSYLRYFEHYVSLRDASGEQISLVIDDEQIEVIGATLSYDGQYVAYVFSEEGSWSEGLAIIHTESKVNSIIIEPDEEISMFFIETVSWSPNSYQLLVGSDVYSIGVLNIACDDNTHQCEIVSQQEWDYPTNFAYQFYPWSPDGRQIAYRCYTDSVNEDGERRDAVCVQDVQEESAYIYYADELGVTGVSSIRWSPNSDYLAFEADSESRSGNDIFTLSIPEGQLFNLTSQMLSSQVDPIWLP